MQRTPESTGRRLAAVATVAGVGVATTTTVRPFGSVAVVAAVGGLAALLWRSRRARLRRRVAAVSLTTVAALAAAGWGAAAGDVAVGAIETVTTLCAGVAVVAGASAGYHETQTSRQAAGRERPTDETPPHGTASPESSTGGGQTADGPRGAADTVDTADRGVDAGGRTAETPGRADDTLGRPADAPGRADGADGRIAEQKRAFYFLNNLLRHHVLNGLNVVDGYAERLAAGEVEPERTTAVIRDRVATMTTVVGNVRAVADVFAGDPDPTVADLADVARRVRDRAGDAHPTATVTVAAPETAEVWCAAGGDAVVWELVENGIVHNDASPRVHLSVVETDDGVWLHVADDGPGIDAAAAELFTPGSTGDQGLGLYLVATLVRYARGEVHVSTPGETTGLPGVAPDGEIPAVVDDGGVCVSLRLRPADRRQPSTPAADRTVEHAIDRPRHGDEGGDDE
jgi:signal transduction histidine kinase